MEKIFAFFRNHAFLSTKFIQMLDFFKVLFVSLFLLLKRERSSFEKIMIRSTLKLTSNVTGRNLILFRSTSCCEVHKGASHYVVLAWEISVVNPYWIRLDQDSNWTRFRAKIT